jgi:dihydrofolate synthase/folylpolyglutamate synthase
MGVPLTVVEPAPLVAQDRDGIVVELPRLGATRVGLVGRHQAANAAVADALLDALEAAGIARASAEARRRGYAAARWPGRLEFLSGVPGVVPLRGEVLLDGAHNPAGAAALAIALDDLRESLPGGPVELLMAAMADKDIVGVVDALRGSAVVRGARIVATQLDAPRAMPADDLAAAWRAAGASDVVAVRDPDAALDAGLAGTTGGLLVVAGSLYLVGAVRARLVDDPALRDPAPTATMDRR